MSRLFDGVDDLMTYALPASGDGPVNYTFGTVLAVVKIAVTADNTWLSFIEVEASGGDEEKAALGRRNTGGLYYGDGSAAHDSTEAGSGTTFTITDSDGWLLVAVTKATGTASPTFYKIPIGGSRTTHQITATSVNSGGLASGEIKLGGDDDFANFRLAVAAILPSVVLSGAQLDSIASAKTTQSIVDVAGANGWVVDDSDAFATNLVADNTDRTAIVGTADDADDPSGWVYGLDSGSPPTNTTPPAVTGTADVGQILTSTAGSWTDSPDDYDYLWQRADNAAFDAGVETIESVSDTASTSDTYTVVLADAGHYIRCSVTADNSDGASDPAASNIVGPVIGSSASEKLRTVSSNLRW